MCWFLFLRSAFRTAAKTFFLFLFSFLEWAEEQVVLRSRRPSKGVWEAFCRNMRLSRKHRFVMTRSQLRACQKKALLPKRVFDVFCAKRFFIKCIRESNRCFLFLSPSAASTSELRTCSWRASQSSLWPHYRHQPLSVAATFPINRDRVFFSFFFDLRPFIDFSH